MKLTDKRINRLKKLKRVYGADNFDFTYKDVAKLFSKSETTVRRMFVGLKGEGVVSLVKKEKGVNSLTIHWDKLENTKQKAEVLKPETVELKEIIEGSSAQVFQSKQFGDLRVFDRGGEYWFFAKEVSEKVGYSNPRDAVKKHVEEDEKDVVAIRDIKLQKVQKRILINEAGLYSLILRSHLPTARVFRKWVTSEVLPNIRKHGAYITPNKMEELINDPDTMITLLKALKKEREEKQKLSKELIQAKPYIELGQAIETSTNSINIGDWVKSISKESIVGRTKAFAWLRDKKYLDKKNMPYQQFINRGYFEVKGRNVKKGDNSFEVFTTYITPKGQLALTQKILDQIGRER